MVEDTHLPMSERLVPGWLQRLAAIGWRVLVTLALGFVFIQIAMLLSTVTASILIALIIAATFAPYVRRLRERGWDRTKAAAGVSLLALAVVTLALVLLVFAFVPYLGTVVDAVTAGSEAIDEWLASIGAPPELSALVGVLTNLLRDALTGALAEAAAPIAAFVTSLILGGFLTFFLLQDGDRAWAWLIEPIQGWRADAISDSGHVALGRVGGYLRGTAILAAIYALSDLVFMLILGVPLAGPLAVLVFLGGFVPYLGGMVASLVMLVVTYGAVGPEAVVIMLLLIAVRNLLVGNTVRPVLYGRTLDVHPALVLVALPAGYALFGAMGLFAALPILAFALAITPSVVLALNIEPDARPAPGGLVPIWLDRLGQWSGRGLVVVGLLGLIVAAVIGIPMVFVPLILGVVMAATLDPTTDALRRRGWHRGMAALVVTLGTVLVIGAIVLVTIVMMLGPLREMLGLAEDGASQGVLGSLGLADLVRVLGSGLLQQIGALISGLAGFGVALLLSTLLTFYLLRDGEAGGRALLRRFGGSRYSQLNDVGGRSARVLGDYMVGTALISLFGAVTTAIIMVILGLPLALPIAVLAFFLGFIPYIGSFIATGLAFLVTVAVGDSTDIVVMAIFTIVFNIAQGNFVAPLVYGRAVSLHPAVILLAIPAGSAVAGIIGMFLVVPFLGVVAISWRTVLHVFDPAGPDDASSSAFAVDEIPPQERAQELTATGPAATPTGPDAAPAV